MSSFSEANARAWAWLRACQLSSLTGDRRYYKAAFDGEVKDERFSVASDQEISHDQ